MNDVLSVSTEKHKFSLRHIARKAGDHEWLVELHNDPIVLRNLTNPEPITLCSHMEWWNELNFDRQLRLIFTVDKERAGFTKFYDIDKHNKNCVLGADLHASHRGKGFAKYMWTLMLDYAFDRLNMHRVALFTAEFNLIAKRVYEKLGFKYEGRYVDILLRDGKFYDGICMYMLKDDWEKKRESIRWDS
jgi:RimJ/RimL family protein N-acetyltransferase